MIHWQALRKVRVSKYCQNSSFFLVLEICNIFRQFAEDKTFYLGKITFFCSIINFCHFYVSYTYPSNAPFHFEMSKSSFWKVTELGQIYCLIIFFYHLHEHWNKDKRSLRTIHTAYGLTIFSLNIQSLNDLKYTEFKWFKKSGTTDWWRQWGEKI